MSDKPYYGPIGETSEQILLEKTFMASGYLTGFGYGVQFVLYLACVRILWQRRPRTRFTYFLLAYITILCAMNTIWTATSAFGLQLTYIDNRNYPGGPFAYLQIEFSTTSNVLSLASYIVGNILADALLLWRTHVIWSAAVGPSVWSMATLIVGVGCIALLGSLSMAVLFAIETASPFGFFSSQATSFALPYFGLSLALNIWLTLMIFLRMLFHRRQGRKIFGTNYGKHYASISTMFIESAALYAISSILLLGTYAPQHPINQIWLGLEPSVQMISSYLIIYRVVEGRAWNSETFNQTGGGMTSIAFEDSDMSKATRSTGDTDVTRTNAVNAFDIPLHNIDIQNAEEKKKSGAGLLTTSVNTEGTTPTDRSSSVMWVSKETV
ncbi:hypothetical protein EIP91_008560 [Steccherinum ochraceum]|uniref:Uncharacterized protein n=1 Tax=Steccherinum ochraceum TaxID=92696 RepID=A0A4R0R2N7_9APHY|nr:hypothetical protein EIP91_008560 [Steccherinum ochraceum]